MMKLSLKLVVLAVGLCALGACASPTEEDADDVGDVEEGEESVDSVASASREDSALRFWCGRARGVYSVTCRAGIQTERCTFARNPDLNRLSRKWVGRCS